MRRAPPTLPAPHRRHPLDPQGPGMGVPAPSDEQAAKAKPAWLPGLRAKLDQR